MSASSGGVFPTRGLYVVIPPEYRSWGVVPPDWFIDDLIRPSGSRYYVALLSAAGVSRGGPPGTAGLPGDSDGRVLDRSIGRVRLRFYISEHVYPTRRPRWSRAHRFDPRLIARGDRRRPLREPRASGGISNVATILAEIGELDGSALATGGAPRRALARRTGWLVERYGPART